MPHLVQQISERAAANLTTVDSLMLMQVQERAQRRTRDYDGTNFKEKDLKVATPKKSSGKKGGEVYKWFAQLRLVFRSKPRAYRLDEDKVAYVLSYISGVAQNWAMSILQALNERRVHELLRNYDAFREAIITVFGDIDCRGNVEDQLGKIR